jgi:hypothetical protein
MQMQAILAGAGPLQSRPMSNEKAMFHFKTKSRRIDSDRPWPLMVLLVLLSPITGSGHAQGLAEYFGHMTLNGAITDGPGSWLSGGLGRFAVGSPESESSRFAGGVQSAHLGISYRHASGVGAFIHAVARVENEHDQGKAIGLTQWLLDYRPIETADQRMTITAGQFFLPTTMENVDALWRSPYTITPSSLTSWIAEEFRPIGLDLDYRSGAADGSGWSIGATLLGGNDSLGALLAWRGWSFGSRFSLLSETLPLPDLIALSDRGVFRDQRTDGSKPFGRDLDGRIGWSLRGAWRNDHGFRVQASYVDNRGDRDLHRGQYAWSTWFGLLGFEWLLADDWVLAGEYLKGNTTMGLLANANVDLDFESAYLLASRNLGDYRLSLRVEHFNNTDRDSTLLDINDDRGEAVTLAWFWEGHPAWRIGVEYLLIDSQRSRILSDGTFNDPDSELVSLQIHYSF